MATNFDKVANESGQSREPKAIIPMVRTTMTWGTQVTQSRMTLDDLLAETERYLTPQDMEKIQRAYNLAKHAHKGAVRRSGEPYIQHPLEVALLLAGMRIDADGIVSALLHDVVEDTEYSLEDLEEQFGVAVANIVDGVTKFDALAGKAPPPPMGAQEEGVSPDVPPPPLSCRQTSCAYRDSAKNVACNGRRSSCGCTEAG